MGRLQGQQWLQNCLAIRQEGMEGVIDDAYGPVSSLVATDLGGQERCPSGQKGTAVPCKTGATV